LNQCNKNKKCTSFTYDYKKINEKNCTQYRGFPKNINKNIKNINSGYTVNIIPEKSYKNMNKIEKENIKRKCAGQYLNLQYRNIHNDLTKCITKIDSNNKNKNTIIFNDNCLWKSLDYPKIIRKSIFKTKFENASKDPIISNAEIKYKKYIKLRNENKKILDKLQENEPESSYIGIKDQYIGKLNNLSIKISNKQKDEQNKIKQNIKKIINGKNKIEKFSNKNDSNFIILIFLSILVILIILYMMKK